MFTLKTISKSNTSFVYHIEVKVADETFFVEMRKHKLTSHKIYLRCTVIQKPMKHRFARLVPANSGSQLLISRAPPGIHWVVK